jgi:hypothetical protein
MAAVGPAGVMELESDSGAGNDLGVVQRHEPHAEPQTTAGAEVLTAGAAVLS